ncbi:hypothetical protein VNO77_41996 [Canavalia gladiata]|uniref:Uncharacterized protein n=1 Tax=Canavalia gladiata TaxID=3824 RepID=A0AAN9K2G9_CANGL
MIVALVDYEKIENDDDGDDSSSDDDLAESPRIILRKETVYKANHSAYGDGHLFIKKSIAQLTVDMLVKSLAHASHGVPYPLNGWLTAQLKYIPFLRSCQNIQNMQYLTDVVVGLATKSSHGGRREKKSALLHEPIVSKVGDGFSLGDRREHKQEECLKVLTRCIRLQLTRWCNYHGSYKAERQAGISTVLCRIGWDDICERTDMKPCSAHALIALPNACGWARQHVLNGLIQHKKMDQAATGPRTPTEMVQPHRHIQGNET